MDKSIKSSSQMQQKQIIREGKYKKDQQRFQIGKYAAENGTAVLVRKYWPNFSKINESTIREFKRKYEVQLRIMQVTKQPKVWWQKKVAVHFY